MELHVDPSLLEFYMQLYPRGSGHDVHMLKRSCVRVCVCVHVYMSLCHRAFVYSPQTLLDFRALAAGVCAF